MTLTTDQLHHRFSFHPADTLERQERHSLVRKACLIAADSVLEATASPSHEQSLAITKLEEAMFWANAAISREERADEGDP